MVRESLLCGLMVAWAGCTGAIDVVEDRGLCPAVVGSADPRRAVERGYVSLDLAGRVEAVDLDGDGLSEVVMLDPTEDRVHVTRVGSTESGGLVGERTSFAVGRRPHAVAAGDVDGDGCVDVVTANFAEDDISVLACPSRGGTVVETRISAGSGPRAVEIVDLDGDGAQEVVVAGALDGSLAVFTIAGDDINRWDPLCGSPGTTALAANIGDEKNELWLVNTELGLLTVVEASSARGLLAGSSSPTAPSPVQSVIVDVNHDSAPDVVVRGLLGDVVVHAGAASGGLEAVAARADVSGSVGVLGTGRAGEVPQVLLSLTQRHGLVAAEGELPAEQRSVLPAPEAGRLYHLLTLDRPEESLIGRVDDTGEVMLLRGHAAPRFDASSSVTVRAAATAVLARADVDADGRDDLLLMDAFTGAAEIRLGGAPETALALPEGVLGRSASFVVGSFDDDVHLDIAFISLEEEALITLRGVGDGTFTVAATMAITERTFAMVAGDISGDGLTDVVFTSSEPVPGTRVAYLATGESKFATEPVVLPGTGGEPQIVDIDGTGGMDLVFEQWSPTPRLQVILAAGPEGFKVRESLTLGGLGAGPVTVDLDRDGALDLVGCGAPSFDPFSEEPDGLLVFLGGVDGKFGEVQAFGVRDAEVPGSPVGGAVSNFSCEGLDVVNSPGLTLVVTHGVLEFAPGERYAAVLTFAGQPEGPRPARYLRGSLLPRLAAEETRHGDFTGDGILDLVGFDHEDALVIVEGRPSVVYASAGSIDLLPPGVSQP